MKFHLFFAGEIEIKKLVGLLGFFSRYAIYCFDIFFFHPLFFNLSFFFFFVYRITELLTNIREGEGRGGDGAGRERFFCVKFLFFFSSRKKQNIFEGSNEQITAGVQRKKYKECKKGYIRPPSLFPH